MSVQQLQGISAMMRLRHFHANMAWGFVFGTDLRIAQVIRLEGFPLLFPTRKEATDAARERNLDVDGAGAVRPVWAVGSQSGPQKTA